MDERHWWIAYKIQESFKIGGNDNPANVETFFSDPDILGIINQFFAARGSNKLFFFLIQPPPIESSGDALLLQSAHLAQLQLSTEVYEVISANPIKAIYMVRADHTKPVGAHAEQHVVCGELKLNLLQQLGSMVGDVCLPLLHSQQPSRWGFAQQDAQRNLFAGLEKISATLKDATDAAVPTEKVFLLKQPNHWLTGILNISSNSLLVAPCLICYFV